VPQAKPPSKGSHVYNERRGEGEIWGRRLVSMPLGRCTSNLGGDQPCGKIYPAFYALSEGEEDLKRGRYKFANSEITPEKVRG